MLSLKTERLAVEIVRMEQVESEVELYDRLREEGISEYEAIGILELQIVDV